MRNKLVVISLFVNLFLFSYAQQYFSKSQLIDDLDSLYFSIREIHPDMFTVISQEDFENEWNAIKTNLEDSLTQLDFYDRIAALVSKIGDGHTGVWFSGNYLDKEKTRLFPFTVKVNKKDYLLSIGDSFSETSAIPEGSRILSINGRKTQKILSELMKYRSGESEHYRLDSVEKEFAGFMWICYRDTSFIVEYKDQDNVSQTVAISGIPISQYSENLKKKSTKKNIDYTYSIDKENRIAIIDFQQFQNPEKFKQFIETVFRDIKEEEIEDLIIDIRNNGGGNSVIGDEFFQYISPVPYKQFGKTVIKVSPRLKQFYKQYYEEELKRKDETPPQFGEYNEWLSNSPDTIYKDSVELKLNELRENPYRFKGNVYLLTSSFTFSSASKFSWAFKYFNMGKVIGEETGGLAVTFGDLIYQTLPNTKFTYTVSHKRFYAYGATDENIHGTLPDYEVNAEDAMNFAIELIKSNRNK